MSWRLIISILQRWKPQTAVALGVSLVLESVVFYHAGPPRILVNCGFKLRSFDVDGEYFVTFKS